MRITLNLAKGFWVGKVKENTMITSIEKKEAERQAAENFRRKRYLMKYEIDGISALLPRLVEAFGFYLLKWDNAKRKPYTASPPDFLLTSAQHILVSSPLLLPIDP